MKFRGIFGRLIGEGNQRRLDDECTCFNRSLQVFSLARDETCLLEVESDLKLFVKVVLELALIESRSLQKVLD
jgi:hypothetical protein